MEPLGRNIYPIWRIQPEIIPGENGLTYGQDSIKIHDHELIKHLPQKLKMILAYYLTYVPGEIWEKSRGEDKKIAESLGNYTTLEKAEQELLNGHEQITKNKNLLIDPKENFPNKLEIKTLGRLLYVEFIGRLDQRRRIDEYKIGKKGEIDFIRRI
ncbi:hypothetical protein AGMMS49944_06580 [Spirochaetia bacterium]|nr:hypothetical protein AGMMS49944_06580 [Spirochaetia bacterium]